MQSYIKSFVEINKIRLACRLASDVIEMISNYVNPGITTIELNNICHEYIIKHQHAIPAPLNYFGFPKSICTSVNEVVCHGIPNNKELKDGDIINIDVTIIKDGFYGDTSKMFIVGETKSSLTKNLVEISQKCLYLGIKEVKPNARLGNIGAVIQKYAEDKNFSVVREYCGHGIGKSFHELPQILHYGKKNTGEILKPGMIFTIEPMINIGTYRTYVANDGWSVITADHKLSSQWEHTVLVTESGYEVLTRRSDEII